MCAPKFHLFLLVPLMIFLQRRWRLGSGFLTGASALLVLSFMAGGPKWPLAYYTLLRSSSISPGVNIMPNLHGLFASYPHATVLEFLGGALVAAAVGVVSRRCSFEIALAATLVGGLLVSHHAYPADGVVLIPALLLLTREADSAGLRAIAFVLLTPVACFGLIVDGALLTLLRLALLFIVGAMAFESVRPQRLRNYSLRAYTNRA
jgi:hypothetical protein